MDLTCTHITVVTKGGTVGTRVAEEIGNSQNSASFIKHFQDKLLCARDVAGLFTKRATLNTATSLKQSDTKRRCLRGRERFVSDVTDSHDRKKDTIYRSFQEWIDANDLNKV